VLGNGEWILHDRKLTLQEYETPSQILDPEQIRRQSLGRAAKAAGMKYITITSRTTMLACSTLSVRLEHRERTPYAKDL